MPVDDVRRAYAASPWISPRRAEIRAAYKTYVDAKLVAFGLEPPDERANRRFL